LILDEATSALDAESETLVNQALQNLLEGSNTTISIAHRLSTIQRSDTIVCLGPDGRVAQVGPYAELVKDKEGAFATLMEYQISGGEPRPPTKKCPSPSSAENGEHHEELTEEQRRLQKLGEPELPKEAEASAEEEVAGTPVKRREG
jgi:putative ABC transport system ATP-binding protein